MPKISSTKGKGFLIKFIIKSVAVSAACIFVLSGAMSLVIQKLDIDMENIRYFTAVIAVLSAAAAAFVSTRQFKSQRGVIGIISVLPIVVYSAVNEIINQNSVLLFCIKIILIIAAGAVFGALSGKKRKKYRIK
ncbi:MAG: TIGR04086 family membrane protein [Clostridiales bacterium]|nr:TIGR04086 family membrane protein [Clostridiales bacterium]